MLLANRHMKRYSSSEKCRLKPPWDVASHLSEWLSSKSQKITDVLGRMWGKWTLVYCWWNCELMQPPWKTEWSFLKITKNKAIIWSSNSTTEHISKEYVNSNLGRYVLPSVHSSIIYYCKCCKYGHNLIVHKQKDG